MTGQITAAVDAMRRQIHGQSFKTWMGRLSEVSPTRLSTTLSDVAVGEVCRLRDPRRSREILSQVVAIRDGEAILAPIGDPSGLSPDTEVIPTREPFGFWAGEFLLGRILDGLGNPVDGGPLPGRIAERARIDNPAPDPLARPVIDTVFETGIRAIDGILTLGHGQRVGLFGDPGAGKSTLLGAMARHAEADVVVLALIGERGRELREFLDRQVPPDVRGRCVVVASTSDRPAMERIIGAHVATSIAEYFRDRGKRVLFLFDSVTRYARALREVGLASGEQAVRRGFTPSVYSELPRLIERCGRTPKGDITAVFTVLTENDGLGDPIAEEIASITDGHIILSPKLGQAGHYPAIDILRSKSRVAVDIVNRDVIKAATEMRRLIAKYREIELLLQVGEYTPGGDPVADRAVEKHDAIFEFLAQDHHRKADIADTFKAMQSTVA
ncbi:MAG: FliI/YscN family ATPase [Hyphomicrobiales bacterium]